MLVHIAKDAPFSSQAEGSNHKGKIIYLPDADEESWRLICEGLAEENTWSRGLTVSIKVTRKPEFIGRKKNCFAEYSIHYNKIRSVSFLIRGTINGGSVFVRPVQLSVVDILSLQDLLALFQEVVEESTGVKLKTPAQ